ncbi:golgin subfamily A member 2 [Brachionus plicatilis]|uniref:Golgin subfamily A member 2 n=1 Tax=Brachionus plicatilis TaxID=10195 RepID=A0A3M7SXW4_BRAPC|nr:golgin subfamily A member 2 [Brachionus plicatilis]
MINNQIELAEKEEKIAAAKQKLKEFKKRNVSSEHESLDKISENNHPILPSASSDTYKKLNLSSLSHTDLGLDQLKDQLKLHIQTIGVLVAEKTELQSKLNQQTKKSDKKQDECDELAGRLKASRQKISQLEKLLQQLECTRPMEKKPEQNQFDSRDLIIDEQTTQINELSQKLGKKSEEIGELIQLVSKLKSQIELVQIDRQSSCDQENDQLKSQNFQLKSQIDELEKKADEQRQVIKNEYQSYVDGLQKQVENLVDQINKLTDEREESFAKIDSLKIEVKNLKDQNTHSKLSQSEKVESDPKVELLENEIKYFKKQIEILLKEQVNLQQIVDNKSQEIQHLNDQVNKVEMERKNFNILLEESHNNKQTISRILVQNNELKSNLQMLQEENTKMKEKIENFEFSQLQNNTELEQEMEVRQNGINGEEEQIENLGDNQIFSNKLSDFSFENLFFQEEVQSREKILDYVKNMKLVEKKFNKIMEENVELREKNAELEHIVQQLEFETETIVDYVTMYQIERAKLNEKYRIKDDNICSLSSSLNIYKLAFVEINQMIDALTGLEEKKKIEKNDELDQRTHFILDSVKKILSELSKNFTKKFNSSLDEENSAERPVHNLNEGNKYEKLDIENNIIKFKAETIICSSCYGDLFIV